MDLTPLETFTPANLAQALKLAKELSVLLDMEFEALKSQELDQFEQLQPAKNKLIHDLGLLCPAAEVLQADERCLPLREALLEGRDLHRRNAVLIERKLEVIRLALQTLSNTHGPSSVEVYDRLGHVSRFGRGRGYADA